MAHVRSCRITPSVSVRYVCEILLGGCCQGSDTPAKLPCYAEKESSLGIVPLQLFDLLLYRSVHTPPHATDKLLVYLFSAKYTVLFK